MKMAGRVLLTGFAAMVVSVGSANRVDAQTVAIADYFPDLTAGNTWNYTIDASVGSPVNQSYFNQTAALSTAAPSGGGTPLQRTSSVPGDTGDSRTFSLGPNGLTLHRVDLSLTSVAFEVPTSPVQITPADVTVGQSYPFSFNYNGQEPGDFWSGSTNGSFQLIGLETVSVPAGTFDTLRILWASTWSEPGHSGGTTETWWLVKGLGIVKQDSLQTSSFSDEPTIDFSAELTGTALLIPGDTDFDGDLDDTDLGTSFSNYTGPVGAVGGRSFNDGDTDNDGDVDDTDLGTLFSAYTGPLSPGVVPEPASAVMLSLAGLLVARRRRAVAG